MFWYVYNPDDQIASDDVYDEGGRSWKSGVRLPVLPVSVEQAAEQDESGGLFQVRRINVKIIPDMWQRRGLPDPTSRDRGLDRIKFERVTYEVRKFQLAGRIGRFYSIYLVTGIEVLPEEVDWDPAMTDQI